MEIENGRFYQKKDYFTDLFRTLTNGFTQKESNEEDIDDIDKIADSYSVKQTASQSKKKAHKKYASNMNARFQDYSANFSCPYPDRSKLTREEKKAMDLQKLFDNMEKNKKKKDRKKVKFDDYERFSPHTSTKNEAENDTFSHDEEKSKESVVEEVQMKVIERQDSRKITKNNVETLLNPNFNLENHDNLFYYLYNYVKEERNEIEEKKNTDYNGEAISNLKIPNMKRKEDGGNGVRRLNKVEEEIFQKTKFIQNSIRRKFKENQEMINVTGEKDLLVRDFTKKHINRDTIKNLLENEFSYY